MEALAADLAGDRPSVDRLRIKECLIVAGVDEVAAHRIGGTIAHCCLGAPCDASNVEATLSHALGGFVVARSAALLTDFKAHIFTRFPRCEDAYWVLNESKSGVLGWDEFQARVMHPLKWPAAREPDVMEIIFRALDINGDGKIVAQAFSLLEEFDATATMEAMLHAGHIISRGRMNGCPQALCPPEPLSVDFRNFNREEFTAAWKELAPEACRTVDARIIFGIVDTNGNNVIEREELALLCDALPRQARAAAAGRLEVLLKKRFGSLEALHTLLLRKDAHLFLSSREECDERRHTTAAEGIR